MRIIRFAPLFIICVAVLSAVALLKTQEGSKQTTTKDDIPKSIAESVGGNAPVCGRKLSRRG